MQSGEEMRRMIKHYYNSRLPRSFHDTMTPSALMSEGSWDVIVCFLFCCCCAPGIYHSFLGCELTAFEIFDSFDYFLSPSLPIFFLLFSSAIFFSIMLGGKEKTTQLPNYNGSIWFWSVWHLSFGYISNCLSFHIVLLPISLLLYPKNGWSMFQVRSVRLSL